MMETFNPINHPICFMRPERTVKSPWTKHIPFALYLMDVLRPRLFVELGTYLGTSYCAFCQAVKELRLLTRCYAVDSWQGDEHSGYYGPEILEDLRQHHDPRYSMFSHLMQMTFDEALDHFVDGSIDLLHLDGYHTYEAVLHDFEGWLPKMSQQGVMVIHDTNEHKETFGVWRLMKEQKQRYPHFEFLHAHGLGILAVGEQYPEPLRQLLEESDETASLIRTFFYRIGASLEAEQQAQSEAALARSELAVTQQELLQSRALATALSTQLEALRPLPGELAETQYALAQVRQELEQIRAYAKELYAHQEEAQRAQAEVESLRTSLSGLFSENQGLRQELQAAQAEQALLQCSRGVRAIKLARTARHLLATQGPAATAKQALCWLGSARGYGKRQEVASIPTLLPTPAEPASGWSVLERCLPADADFEGVSIVIPIFNALDYARACVQSIYQARVSVPFEVIAVDNGSQPEVRAWLQAEAQQRDRFFYLSLSQNLGFAKAVNLGIEHTRGQYIVIHNSDTAATSGWLDALVQAAEDDPRLGIVSPVTNYVGEGWQLDEAARALPVEQAEAYAASIQARKCVLPIPDHLVFFSVMVKRAVLDVIGGLDEGFGLGNFEDDEYCLRARLAGFTLGIVQHAFVYHHGSKTFAANHIDHSAWMDQNRQRYLDKMTDSSIVLPPQVQRLKPRGRGEVSVMMRTFNRPETLQIALRSLVNQTLEAFEVVLVNDGGDDVSEVVQQFEPYFPITYIQHAERKGPGAALNTAVQAARGAWITYLDDDDIIYPTHLESLWATLQHRYPGAHFVYSDYNQVLLDRLSADATILRRMPKPRWAFNKGELYINNYLPMHTWMHSRACLEYVGGFDECAILFEDWDFQLRLVPNYAFYPTQRLTCELRLYLDANNSTVKRRAHHLEQLDRLYERHPVEDPTLQRQRQALREQVKVQMASLEKLRRLEELRIVSEQEVQRKVLSLLAGF